MKIVQRLGIGMLILFAAVSASFAADDFVWIEGESPSSINAKADEAGYRLGPLARPDWQSGKRMLSFQSKHEEAKEKFPKEGLIVGYDVDLKDGGRYEIWARIGFEFARSPFDWRLDGGEWKTISPSQPTIDLVELSLWNQIGWLRFDTRDLKTGKHTIEFRHKPAFKEKKKGKKKGVRSLHMLDAICFSTGSFQPNGKFKPGEEHMDEVARQAATQVFAAEAALAGRRRELALTGLWQIARWDEYGDDRAWNDGDIPVETQWKGVETLPKLDDLFWYGVYVPRTLAKIDGKSGGYAGGSGGKSGKPPLFDFAHRVIYRTRVKIPAELNGRGLSLDFEQFNMIASVFVNGRFVKWSKNHDAPWEVDISNAVKPGEVNEIAIVIKSHYYAINRKRVNAIQKHGVGLRGVFGYPAGSIQTSTLGPAVDLPVSAPKSDGNVPGITDRVKLVVAGGKPYVEDVFAKPSVSRKRLDVEITLENPEAKDVTVELRNATVPWSRDGDWKAAQPVLQFVKAGLVAKAGMRSTFELGKAWAEPKLWWPDDPKLYVIKTEVMRDGKVVDTKWTRFGFREWGWKDGVLYTVNGKPWQFWNDLKKSQLTTPQTLVETAKKTGRNSKRFWGKMHRGWGGMTKREILNYFDENGIVVRDTGAFDGQVFNYARGLTANDDGSKGYNERLFQNVLDQQLAWVRGYRNHACILIWTMENEVAFVSAANAGQLEEYCPAITYVGHQLMKLDPTRPVMIDGGDALLKPDEWQGDGPWVEPARKMGQLPVNGGHYTETGYGVTGADFPDSFYTAEHWYSTPNERGGWTMVRNQPIHHGEIFYGRGWPVDRLAEIGGEIVYRSDADTYPVRSLIARMMNEGYRFNDVSSGWAIFDGDLTTDHQIAWSPIILLTREWNWTFGSGRTVHRKLRVINQTSKVRTLTAKWELEVDGDIKDSGSKTVKLDIGGRQYWEVDVRIPALKGITAGQFVLTVAEGDTEYFRDEKPIRIIEWDGVPAPKTRRQTFVLDSSGELKKRLKERGLAFKEVARPGAVPEGDHVLFVGRNAVTAEMADDPQWQFLANSGARIVVFEQEKTPLRGRALPTVMESTSQRGKITHPQMTTHPAMKGLTAADFFCWSGDHNSYINAYVKPTAGALPILQAGAALAFTPLVEARTDNDGFMILNQTLSLTKIDTDPTARRLTDQLINYAYDYKLRERKLVQVLPRDSYVAKMLADAGVSADFGGDPMAAMDAAPGGVVLLQASKAALAKLIGNGEKVRQFRRNGGWLVLYDVTPELIADFNKLVGIEHMIRPATREAMAIVLPRGPVATGLNMNDVVMTTGKRIAWWKGTEFRSHDAYSYIVDYHDIVPFATINGAPPKREANSTPKPRNVANGLSGDEFWRYLAYFEASKGQEPKLDFEWPRKETFDNFEIAFDTGYSFVTTFTLDFHDGGEVLTFEPAPVSSVQSFTFKPRTTSKITFTVTKHDVKGKKDVLGISTIRMVAARSKEFEKKVKPLSEPAALVAYPEGQGGTLLMNIQYQEVEANPANVSKKRNLTQAVLSNLGVRFAGGASVVVGDASLTFKPLVLPESAYNIFPRRKAGDGRKSWFQKGGGFRNEDMAGLPGGDQRLDGILFRLNDFAMADVPTIVALAGKGSPVKTKIVKKIPVKTKAEALFFLHTYHPERMAQRVDDNLTKARTRGDVNKLVNFAYPVVLEYVVHYADGSNLVIPVRYRREIGPWIGEELPESNAYARVAWRAAAGKGKGYLAVYSMQWNNPEPNKEIATIDIRLPKGTKNLEQYGAPAIFAISVATSK